MSAEKKAGVLLREEGRKSPSQTVAAERNRRSEQLCRGRISPLERRLGLHMSCHVRGGSILMQTEPSSKCVNVHCGSHPHTHSLCSVHVCVYVHLWGSHASVYLYYENEQSSLASPAQPHFQPHALKQALLAQWVSMPPSDQQH